VGDAGAIAGSTVSMRSSPSHQPFALPLPIRGNRSLCRRKRSQDLRRRQRFVRRLALRVHNHETRVLNCHRVRKLPANPTASRGQEQQHQVRSHDQPECVSDNATRGASPHTALLLFSEHSDLRRTTLTHTAVTTLHKTIFACNSFDSVCPRSL
jgi:hypothetical protein